MVARYKGFCAKCQRPIFPGQQIQRGNGSTVHVSCPRFRAGYTAPTASGDYTSAAARFASQCSRCNRGIEAGEQIMYRKGERAFHAACATETDAPAQPRKVEPEVASREEQHARYIDCGPNNWDDRDASEPDVPDDFEF